MPVPVIVLNFGHSVLRSLDDYTHAASEIYHHYRQGMNVVAVTSAQHDQTDILMAEARRIGPLEGAKNLPELLQLGERRSAALLSLALERIGAPAFVCQARDLGLTARKSAAGDYLEAELIDLDVEQLLQDLQRHDIVVMPGFVAIGEDDRPALLGQGGADLTALYVASRLHQPALLLKDVDGVYSHDPKETSELPHRFSAIEWDEVQKRAEVLIAPKALEFAKQHQFEFDLGQPGKVEYTRIGRHTTAPQIPLQPRKLRIVMMGCGVVGGGVYRRLIAYADRYVLAKIMVRDVEKYIDQGYAPDLFCTDFATLESVAPDIFIDVSGPIEPALDIYHRFLDQGVHVVSANKQAVAAGGIDLLGKAHRNNLALFFSSAAGGGMPVLEMCQRESGKIACVEALLNGTSNYILDQISAGKSYGQALLEAQEKGFAEADPSADVSGQDAVAKLRLIALLGFGQVLDSEAIETDSIENFSFEAPLHGVFKRIAKCWMEEGKCRASLKIQSLPRSHFLAQALNEEAHAIFTFTDGSHYKIRGKGAGRWPTTESIMADIFDIAHQYD